MRVGSSVFGSEKFPPALIRAVGLQKQAAAQANLALGELPEALAQPIAEAARPADRRGPACGPISAAGLADRLRHANQHERQRKVIATIANEALGEPRGSRARMHPNDHVNIARQSSNDSFPTVMHIAAVEAVHRLMSALATLQAALERRAAEWADIVKVGRTHMMDAVPVTLGQEFAAWARQVELGIERLHGVLPRLLSVPQGGTAVGTGLNGHPKKFDRVFCEQLSALDRHACSHPIRTSSRAWARTMRSSSCPAC